jgi:hypothetical protein
MYRQFLLKPPPRGKNLILHDKAYPSQNNQSHYGEINDYIALILHQIIREKGIPAIVEGGNSVIHCMIEGPPGRIILIKPDKQEKCPCGLNNESKSQDPFQDHEEIPAGRMEECGLGNISSLKGNASPHKSEKDNGKCDDSQSADLHKKQGYNLPGYR